MQHGRYVFGCRPACVDCRSRFKLFVGTIKQLGSGLKRSHKVVYIESSVILKTCSMGLENEIGAVEFWYIC